VDQLRAALSKVTRTCSFKLGAFLSLVSSLLRPTVGLASFEDDLHRVVTFGSSLPPTPAAAAAVEEIVRSAIRTADFVATPATPGFRYVYNPDLQTFERTPASRGSVFVEPAETVGKGRIDLSATYLYANFTEINGEPLSTALAQVRMGPVTALSQVRDFGLKTQVLDLSATYGITSRWDVNLLLPLLATTLNLNVLSGLAIPGQLAGQHVDDTAFGPGDLLLRTKYRLPDWAGMAWAGFFTLRLPSGNPANFQGLGDVTLTPGIALTRPFGPHDLHANLAFEANANDVSQSRVRYAIGATIQALRPVALLLDVIGSSGIAADNFEQPFATAAGVIPVSGTVARTDLVDLAAGVRITITRHLLVHLDAIVPLTQDGIRPNVVPAGGIEATF
jgi:hypothetical protein